MPRYKGLLGHRNQTVALSLALASLPVLAWNWKLLAVPLGCLAGLRLSPDLDLHNALGFVGRLGFADEYTKLVPHRHWLSHTPIISTGIRVVVLFGIPLLLFAVFGASLPWDLMGYAFLGLCAADALHIFSDRLQTRLKRAFYPLRTVRRKR